MGLLQKEKSPDAAVLFLAVPEENPLLSIGTILLKDAFSEFFVFLNRFVTQDDTNDQILNVPAGNREEAVELMKRAGNDRFRAS